jgi:hypothetical protein
MTLTKLELEEKDCISALFSRYLFTNNFLYSTLHIGGFMAAAGDIATLPLSTYSKLATQS